MVSKNICPGCDMVLPSNKQWCGVHPNKCDNPSLGDLGAESEVEERDFVDIGDDSEDEEPQETSTTKKHDSIFSDSDSDDEGEVPKETSTKRKSDSIFSDSEDEELPAKKHVDLIDLSERTDDEEEPVFHQSKKLKTTCVSCGDDECKTPISYVIQCPCGEPHCPCGNGACDLGECDVCGYHTTCICQRCGGDGSMEYEGCSCDCRVCNSDTNECFCDTKTPLPCGTVHAISRFQAVVRSYLVRKSFT